VTHGRLRAPAQDGAVLAEPSLDQIGAVLSRNRARLAHPNLSIFGRTLADLRVQARHAALDAARGYLRAGDEPLPTISDGPLLMAGHQPELFHPGVWAKNFALNGMAKAQGGAALNLVVDNDTAKSEALRVPTPANDAVAWPHTRLIVYDRWTGEIPYEEHAVADEGLFASFPDRVEEAMRGWGFKPLVATYWAEVSRQRTRTRLLGERIAAARRRLEQAWGCHNLEVPVSRICSSEPFALFACHILADLPRFHAIHNEAVHEYRRRNGIRSRTHPVPDLASDGDWLEAPFWGWRTAQPRRGRLLVRRVGGRIELRAGADEWPSIPLDGLADRWVDLQDQGFKIRSRALTNTLYARILLADLFVHGIGGAKYDELTDVIIQRFFPLEPPEFVVLSATRLLPVPVFDAHHEDVCRLGRRLRDLEYNPQRFLKGDLADQRRAWIVREPTGSQQRRDRFHAIRELTARMRPELEAEIAQTKNRLEETKQMLAANAVLRRRDYASCLFPDESLRPFVTQFLHNEVSG
jgi:hypothetical protein